MKTNANVVYDTAIGKTINQFDPVNLNAGSIKIDTSDVKALIGLYVNYTPTKMTDAENPPDMIVQYSNKTLGIADEQFVVPFGGSDADALQGRYATATQYFKLKLTSEQISKLEGSEFKFKIAPSHTNTEGLTVVICLAWADEVPDADYALELLTQMIHVGGGVYNNNSAKAMATDDVAVNLSDLTIEAGKTMINGVLGKMNPNAITVDDPCAGVFEFTGAGIEPLVVPFTTFFSPCLGTNTIANVATGRRGYYPWRTKITDVGHTIKVKITPIVGQGTAPDITQAMLVETE